MISKMKLYMASKVFLLRFIFLFLFVLMSAEAKAKKFTRKVDNKNTYISVKITEKV